MEDRTREWLDILKSVATRIIGHQLDGFNGYTISIERLNEGYVFSDSEGRTAIEENNVQDIFHLLENSLGEDNEATGLLYYAPPAEYSRVPGIYKVKMKHGGCFEKYELAIQEGDLLLVLHTLEDIPSEKVDAMAFICDIPEWIEGELHHYELVQRYKRAEVAAEDPQEYNYKEVSAQIGGKVKEKNGPNENRTRDLLTASQKENPGCMFEDDIDEDSCW